MESHKNIFGWHKIHAQHLCLSVILSLPSLSFLYYIDSFSTSYSELRVLFFSLSFYSSFSAYTLNCTEGVLYILTYFKIMSYVGRLLQFIHKTNPYKSLCLKNKICIYSEGYNFAWFCSTFYVKKIFTQGCFCKSTLVIFCKKLLLFYDCRVVLYLRFSLVCGESKHRFSVRKIYRQVLNSLRKK